jgi:hypothetical protein
LKLKDEENVFLAEESLEDLIYLPVTQEILSSGLDYDQALEIWSQDLLGTAYHLKEPEEIWLILTDHYADKKQITPPVRAERVYASEASFFKALVEYFSTALAEELLCESCHQETQLLYVPERITMLRDFLEPLLPSEREVLEVCCGSGMSTQALEALGYAPFATDIDRCEVCQGLKGGKLAAERTFVLDARRLDRFFPDRSFDLVLGFMMGLIDQSNWHIWEEVIQKSASLAREMVLYTVYSEQEALRIAKSLDKAGWHGEIIDNSKTIAIYDQWAYVGRR